MPYYIVYDMISRIIQDYLKLHVRYRTDVRVCVLAHLDLIDTCSRSNHSSRKVGPTPPEGRNAAHFILPWGKGRVKGRSSGRVRGRSSGRGEMG